MSILAVPNVASDLESTEVPAARRAPVRSRSDDTSPFASLFAQVQTASPRPNDGADRQRGADDASESSNSRAPVTSVTRVGDDDGGSRSSTSKSARSEAKASQARDVGQDGDASTQRSGALGSKDGSAAKRNDVESKDAAVPASGASQDGARADATSAPAANAAPVPPTDGADAQTTKVVNAEAPVEGASAPKPEDAAASMTQIPVSDDAVDDVPLVAGDPFSTSAKVTGNSGVNGAPVDPKVSATPTLETPVVVPESVFPAMVTVKDVLTAGTSQSTVGGANAKASDEVALDAPVTQAPEAQASAPKTPAPQPSTAPVATETDTTPTNTDGGPVTTKIEVTPQVVSTDPVTAELSATGTGPAPKVAQPEFSAPPSDEAVKSEAPELILAQANSSAKPATSKTRAADTSGDVKPTPRAKEAPVVVAAPPASDATDAAAQVTSTAKYVSAPEVSETEAAVANATKAAPAPKAADSAEGTEKASPKSSAKYVTGPEASSQSAYLNVDDAVSDAAKAVAAGAGKRTEGPDADSGSGSASKTEIGPGGIQITPLSKVDTVRPSSGDDTAPANGRLDSTPTVLAAADKTVQAKAVAGKALEAPARPTLDTVSDFTVKGVRYLVSNGEKTLTVRMVPESLGELRLEVTSNDNTVSVRMVSASPAVREALQSQMHGLRETLTRDGFTVAQATVSAQMSSDSASKGFAGRQTPYFSQGATSPWRTDDLGAANGGRVTVEPKRTPTHSGVLNLFA